MGKIYAKDHQNTPLRTSATLQCRVSVDGGTESIAICVVDYPSLTNLKK